MSAASRPHWALMLVLTVLSFIDIMPDGIHGCIESERKALMGVKSRLQYHHHELESWHDGNCCRWAGVLCSDKTGHVVGLDLSGIGLSGEISHHLLGLQHLNYLNLNSNSFNGEKIPKFLGSFTRLKYLDLSDSGFIGLVPHELGNISKLVHLDLHFQHRLYLDSADWIAGLTSLQYLDMSHVNLSKVSNWVQALNALPSIREVTLSGCLITAIPDSLPQVNFTSLSHLDLSGNEINSTIPEWLFLTSLQYLDLSLNFGIAPNRIALVRNSCSLGVLRLRGVNISTNIGELEDAFSGCLRNSLEELDLSVAGLTGNLPSWLWEMKNLHCLDLSDNSLHGAIPISLGNLIHMQDLDLMQNSFDGQIPTSLGQLINLEVLSLGDNSFSGVLSEEHFSNLTRLKVLNISDNPSLVFNVDPNWNPPFQLEMLLLSSLRKVGRGFPTWICTQEKLNILVITDASISGTIPSCFWKSLSQLGVLDFSSNNISGKVEPFNSSVILYLDLSSNYLSGSIPNCWDNSSQIWRMNLSNNYLSGVIPNSLCSNNLVMLDLGHNNLSGSIPYSISNCKQLAILDISYNSLDGAIPAWLGESLSSLLILRLNSNMFAGKIPFQLSNLTALRILDLSHNYLAGTIPKHFGELKAMKTKYPTTRFLFIDMYLGIKGRELLYDGDLLLLVVSIDLSCNRLSGSIPEELGHLSALVNLNLSKNTLTGGLIRSVDGLRKLETLDLSWNNLSGVIPSSLSSLSFLQHLNLSYNNFSGKIPSGNQLQTLDDPSIYIGNNGLCGFPLKECLGDEAINSVPSSVYKNESEASWFYFGLGSGFAIGFNIVLILLLLNKSCRNAYFKFVDDLYDKIYVFIVLKVVRCLY